MELESAVGAALTAVDGALERLASAVGGGGLDHLDDDALLGFWQQLEAVRNRFPVVEHHLVAAAQGRDLAKRFCRSGLVPLLAQALRIGAGDAASRVRAAEALGERVSVLGELLPPARPVLAAAQRAGTVGPAQVDRILLGLAKVDRPGFEVAEVARGEVLLTGYAASFGPRALQTCVDRFVDALDPDGSRPPEELVADRRLVELPPQRDGSWRGELRLTGVLGARLAAVLGPLAKPRLVVARTADGRTVEEPDARNRGQRLHDALEEVCDRLLRTGSLPGWGGAPATVVVMIDEDSLRARTGCGTTADGTPLSAAAVLALADQAEVVPTVLSASGAVLTLGRSRRIASREQTLALVARDRGCSFPGCDRPPQWCDRHHVRPWIEGGSTDLDNLTLVCRYHHTHFALRGWACRLSLDGLPEWVPPRHVDRAQRPLLNDRIRAAHDLTPAA